MNQGGPSEQTFGPGDVLAGKYRIERVIGQGGMGVVVAAHHLQLDERVALKFLLPGALDKPEAVARFMREARAAAKIKNEHVVRVSDVGQLENGSPYIVMEFLEGQDLADVLGQRRALPIEEAVDLVLQACEALAEAHAVGIVHRDLKPANLFCTHSADGQPLVKVLDFGISKVTQESTAGQVLTRTSAMMGSPLYMSPEQMRVSKGVDGRTDIWSLGVILYELLAGRPPFDAEAVTELAIKVATQAPPPMLTFAPNAPPALESVVRRCLEKDREQRYANVGELAAALEGFGSKRAGASVEKILGTLRRAGLSTATSPLAGAPARTANIPAGSTQATWGTTGAGVAPRRRALAGVVGAALVVVAAVVVVRMRADHATKEVAPSPVVSVSQLAVPPPAPTPAPSDSTSSGPLGSAAPATAPTQGDRAAPSASAARTGSRPSPAPAPAPAKPKPNCNPPYVIDASGHRQYKPECL